MGKEVLTFGDIEIKNKNFTGIKDLFFKKMQILRKYLHLTRFLIVKKNYKHFIGYLYNDHKVKPILIMLSKTSTYVKSYDGQTKLMYFLVEDDDSLGKYNTIWDKVSTDIKKEFDSKPVYNNIF